MATKTALTAKNLEALGPERLAELLIEITADNPAAKRRLRLELARAQSPAEVAKEVRKRLTILARSRSFVDRHGARSLADDLNSQRHAIGARDEFHLAATAQNLRKLAKLITVPSPIRPA